MIKRLSTGDFVRIIGKDGIYRVSGISYFGCKERIYYFSLGGESGIVGLGSDELDKVELICIGDGLLRGNGFMEKGEGIWRKDIEGGVMEYDMVRKEFIIRGDNGEDVGRCDYLNEMQDKIKGSGYWGKVDIKFFGK